VHHVEVADVGVAEHHLVTSWAAIRSSSRSSGKIGIPSG
jgi:hypothetical protein